MAVLSPSLVTDFPQGVRECREPELGLEELLRHRCQLLQQHEEYQVLLNGGEGGGPAWYLPSRPLWSIRHASLKEKNYFFIFGCAGSLLGRLFSSCGERGGSPLVGHQLLTTVVSFVNRP